MNIKQVWEKEICAMDITEHKQMEEAVKRSNEFSETVLNSINDAISVINAHDYSIVGVNTSFLKQCGVKEEQVKGKTCYEITHHRSEPCVPPDDICPLQNTVASGEYSVAEHIHYRDDGKKIYVEVSTSPMKDENGKVIQVIHISRDITERRKTEGALRESEENFRNSVGNSPLGITIGDMEGKLLYANKTMLDIGGYSSIEELITVPEEQRYTPETYVEYRKRIQLGKPTPASFEIGIVRNDGEVRHLTVSRSEIIWDGEKRFQTIYQDITERKQAEETLKESEDKFRTFMETSNDSMFITAKDGRFTWVNESMIRTFGYSKEEIIGMHITQLLTKETVENTYKSKTKELLTKGEISFEDTWVAKDGRKIHCELKVVAFYDSDGKFAGSRGVFRDLTERKRAGEEREALLEDLQRINRKLEESNRSLQDFVYVASHDLREPLRKISSFGALLQYSLGGKLDEDQQENFEFMIDGSKRMQAMIDDLLTYSHVTTKAKSFEQVNLDNVIEDLKNLELATMLGETKATIHIPETLPPVHGDSSQIHQLLQNLVANGIKFHREGVLPEITIQARRVEGNMVRVEVQDNGIGIGKEYDEQVFTMFKRLHSREQYEGTGIGLAVCKKIVSRHEGDIGVKSTPGEGSTFWFTLPRGSY